jgi:Na+-driven multidrug efflux pump
MKLLYRILLALAVVCFSIAAFGPTLLKWLHQQADADVFGLFIALMYVRAWLCLLSACFFAVSLTLRDKKRTS